MNRLFLCLLCFSMFACDKTLGPPEGVLSEKKMVSMLVDLQLAESKVKTLRVSSDSIRHIFSIYEVKIFDKHNVTAAEYLRSYEYYLENHRLMSRVHEAVLDTLMQRQQKIEKMPIPEPLKKPEIKLTPLQDSLRQDSIRRATLLRDSLRADSLVRIRSKHDSIKRRLRKPFIKRDRQ